VQNILKNAPIFYRGRKGHLASFLARFGLSDNSVREGNVLLLSGNILFSEKLFEKMKLAYRNLFPDKNNKQSVIFIYDNKPFAVYLNNSSKNNFNKTDSTFFEDMLEDFSSLHSVNLDYVEQINFLWNTLGYNGKCIEEDFIFYQKPKLAILPNSTFYLINAENIFIGMNTTISAGAVIDATEGPVVIDERVKIMPNSVIFGPCYIGKNSVVKAGSKIYEDTSIGEFCKVSGEIENSIIHAYSNKQHEGFLGHSYLCEWINLGADTNTSDLKNTYAEIEVRLNDNQINTGRMFLGLMCGDHSKSGINAMYNTGTIAGISGMHIGEWYLPGTMPSFFWGGRKNHTVYNIEKAIQVAKIVMARRNKKLLPEEELLMRQEYERIHKR